MLEHSHYKAGCDAHKHDSFLTVCDGRGQVIQRTRVNPTCGAICAFLSRFPEGTPIAMETVGRWYCLHLWRRRSWIVDEIEEVGCLAILLLNLWSSVKWAYLFLAQRGPRQVFPHLLPLAGGSGFGRRSNGVWASS